jgi:predicted SprT family Zn-dependent metalloprotease
MNKFKLLKIIKETKKKIYNTPKTLKDISEFENNIKPLLCKSCQIKLIRVKGGNILNIVVKGNYFCKECNNIIAQKSTEIFIKI